jgi:RES domain-containing protein
MMEVFRISTVEHASVLTASGSANRWNKRGQNVIYSGASRSLVTLESVVHKSSIRPATTYKVMVISIPDNESFIKGITQKELPANWQSLSAYPTLQAIGSEWYEHHETLLLKVPSVIIPYEFNFVINADHPAFSKNIKLIRTEDYFFDKRLLS